MTLQWDKAEYNFFMELADDEKVYYLYDWLFHSEEFADDWEDEQSQLDTIQLQKVQLQKVQLQKLQLQQLHLEQFQFGKIQLKKVQLQKL